MDKNSISSDNNVIKEFEASKLPNTDLDFDLDFKKFEDITDSENNTLKLSQRLYFQAKEGTSSETNVNFERGAIAPDFEFILRTVEIWTFSKLIKALSNLNFSPFSKSPVLSHPQYSTITDTNNSLDADASLFAAASAETPEIIFVPLSENDSINALLYPTDSERTIDGIALPTKWSGDTITYSFFDGGSYYGDEGNVEPITEIMRGYLRDIVESLENYINIDFVEVPEVGGNYGQIRYMFSDDPSTANTRVPSKYNEYLNPAKVNPINLNSRNAGDVHFNPDKTGDFEEGPGSYRYETLIHETLHALSFKHSGDYNGSSTGGQSGKENFTFLPPEEDNSNNTIMSYNRLRYTPNYSGTITPMAYDIRALQYLYGAANYNEGDTTYQFAKIDDYTVGGESFGNPDSNSKQTLWDSGGKNTFDFSQLDPNSSGYRFDTREGGVITSQDAYLDTEYTARSDNSTGHKATSRGTFIAYDVSIHDVITSGSDDYIIANKEANTFSGYSLGKSTGDDVIVGSNGSDTLDLSDYTVSDFTTSDNGNDYVINLNSDSKITIKDYYAVAEGDRINILTSNANPAPAPNLTDLVWEDQTNLVKNKVVEKGSVFNIGKDTTTGEDITTTLTWDVSTNFINKDNNDNKFVRYGGEDFVKYKSGKLGGNDKGYLSLGFNSSENNPDNLIKLSFNFSQAVAGLNFTILDVDKSVDNYFSDGVEIHAKTKDSNNRINIKDMSGVEILTGNNVSPDDETYMNGFEGIGNAGNTSDSANLKISFGSTQIHELEIKYFSTDDAIANPNRQKIGISDLHFNTK